MFILIKLERVRKELKNAFLKINSKKYLIFKNIGLTNIKNRITNKITKMVDVDQIIAVLGAIVIACAAFSLDGNNNNNRLVSKTKNITKLAQIPVIEDNISDENFGTQKINKTYYINDDNKVSSLKERPKKLKVRKKRFKTISDLPLFNIDLDETTGSQFSNKVPEIKIPI